MPAHNTQTVKLVKAFKHLFRYPIYMLYFDNKEVKSVVSQFSVIYNYYDATGAITIVTNTNKQVYMYSPCDYP